MSRKRHHTPAKDHIRTLHDGLSARALTCLKGEFGEDFTPDEVIAVGTKRLMRTPNLGKKTVAEIVAWVRASTERPIPLPSDPELEEIFVEADEMDLPEFALRIAMRAIWEGMSPEDRNRALARMREVYHDVRLAGTPPRIPARRMPDAGPAAAPGGGR